MPGEDVETAYYRDLYAYDEAHVRAGWRHPFEQEVRFLMACELPWRGGTLLDLGCGEGELVGHLDRGGWFSQGSDFKGLYVGVDRIEAAILSARRRWPGYTFQRADFALGSCAVKPATTVMAIGAMVSGEPCGAAARLARVRAHMVRVMTLSMEQGVAVLLEQGWLEQSASLQLERALFGVRAGEELDTLREWLEQRFGVKTKVRRGGLRSDVVLYWQASSMSELEALTHRSDEALCEEVFAALDPGGIALYWRGWLLAMMGLEERACASLERARREDEDMHLRQRATLLLERLTA